MRMVLFFGAAYLVIGLAFAAFSDQSATTAVRLTWRRLAWLVSGVGFAAHIAWGHFRRGNAPRATALHACMAAALGAFGLAVAANLHQLMAAAPYRPSMGIALIVWPLLTAVPAFAVAMITAAVLNRWYARSETTSGPR